MTNEKDLAKWDLLLDKYSIEGEALIEEIYNLRANFVKVNVKKPEYIYLGHEEWLKLHRYPKKDIYLTQTNGHEGGLLLNMKVFRVCVSSHINMV